jgi:hypothetical protein
MTPLPRVRPGLLHHKLDEQVLVYDSRGDKVHLLDPTTACVLTLLEEGGWTREGVAAELFRRLGIDSSETLVPLAVEELRAADLLEITPEPEMPLADVTRRELLRKIGLTGAAALLIPAIVTFTATPGYAQTSAGGALLPGAVCTGATPATSCGPGLFCYASPGNGSFCATNGCTKHGQACSQSSDCCATPHVSGNNCAPSTCKN